MVEISLSGSGEGPGASKRPGLLDNPNPRPNGTPGFPEPNACHEPLGT
jgi:hypothetical protein